MIATGSSILGTVKFLKGYYLILVTKSSLIVSLMGRNIYAIDDYMLIPLFTELPPSFWQKLKVKPDSDLAEKRYKEIFMTVGLTKGFYFSYTYNLTRTAQANIVSVSHHHNGKHANPVENVFYKWNKYLCKEISNYINDFWLVTLVHGSILHHKCSIYGNVFGLTLIARRSRRYAGTRYLKRGIDDKGHVANDIEIEQIIEDSDGYVSSYVQVCNSFFFSFPSIYSIIYIY